MNLLLVLICIENALYWTMVDEGIVFLRSNNLLSDAELHPQCETQF